MSERPADRRNCGSRKDGNKRKAEAASEDGAQDKKSDLVVGMIASAFGTQSYNDDVLAGMELAEKELGVKGIPLEVRRYPTLQTACAH